MVRGQNVQIPPNCNAQILVGDHFDHQPDNRNALLCKSGDYHFGNHHIPVTFGANNAFHYPPHTCNSQRRMPMTTEQWKREIRTPWWNISLMATPVCAGSNVNTAARSSTPKPGTANIAASRLAVTRCWIWGKALKSALSEESIPALAAGSSSYQFGRMPDIAAMPVVRKTTAIVKRPHTLLF